MHSEGNSSEINVTQKEGKGRVWPMSALREVYSRGYVGICILALNLLLPNFVWCSGVL